jgi:hypothetical protein
MLCRETVRVLYAAQASADRPRARTVGRATGRALCLSAWHAARVQTVVRELMALIQAPTRLMTSWNQASRRNNIHQHCPV